MDFLGQHPEPREDGPGYWPFGGGEVRGAGSADGRFGELRGAASGDDQLGELRGAGSADGRFGEVRGRASGDDRLGGEVLESGAERQPGEGGLERLVTEARRWWPSPNGSATRWGRRAVAATAALAAAGALVALRAGTPAVRLADQAAAADATIAPVIIYGRARMQPPPFDRLPGRTPIPLPSAIGRPAEAVRGALPATGTAGEEAARGAARLVLGRYCRYPRAYQIVLEDGGSWREVTATVLHWTYVEPRRLTTLRLRWTGRTYAWQGWPSELARCA